MSSKATETASSAFTSGLQALREAVEHYFSEEYLFEPENSYFRECVSPSDAAEDGEEATPAVSCTSLLNLPAIHAALQRLEEEGTGDGSADVAATAKEQAQARRIAEAVAGSRLVEVVTASTEAGSDEADPAVVRYSLRRAAPLDPKKDPALRTVVARPLPLHLTLEEVAEFFLTCGGGGRVERVKALRPGAGAEGRRVGNPLWTAYAVRFATAEEAMGAVRHFQGERPSGDADEDDEDAAVSAPMAKRSRAEAPQGTRTGSPFGPTACALAQRFFPPRLVVTWQADFAESQRQQRKALEERQLRLNVLKAQTQLSHAAEAPADAAVTHYLKKECSLAVDALPDGVQWGDVKKALGELGAVNERVKGCVQLVQVVGGGEDGAAARPPRKAFVVCKSPEAAAELLVVYSVSEGKARAEVRKAVPSLRALTAEEEQFCQTNFPTWCTPKVAKKRQSNQRWPKHHGGM